MLWWLEWKCSAVEVEMECSVEVMEVKWWNCGGMEVDGGWCCDVVDWPKWRSAGGMETMLWRLESL